MGENTSVSYSYDQKKIVDVSASEIKVDCDCNIVVVPETCPKPADIALCGCNDTVEYDAGGICLESLGRIVQLDVTLKNVCPNKRVALAVILTEEDSNCEEYKRGMKTLMIPAHTKDSCRDVTVKCIRFVLPEKLDTVGSSCAICNDRKLKARFIAHYIDFDFECCEISCK